LACKPCSINARELLERVSSDTEPREDTGDTHCGNEHRLDSDRGQQPGAVKTGINLAKPVICVKCGKCNSLVSLGFPRFWNAHPFLRDHEVAGSANRPSPTRFDFSRPDFSRFLSSTNIHPRPPRQAKPAVQKCYRTQEEEGVNSATEAERSWYQPARFPERVS
jgi:hypothetical protein